MRKKILVRCGIASILIGGGIGGVLAGCGSDSNNPPANNGDSGSDSSPTGDDTGTTNPDGNTSHPDTGTGVDGGDASPPPVHGKLLLVHASAYAPSLRFCFGFAHGDAGAVTIAAKTFPAPNSARGVPPGTGGPAADTATDIAGQAITIYGIAAGALTAQVPDAGSAELNCNQLLATDAGGLTEGVDYWNLGTLPSGTLADGTTTLVAVTGCAPGNTTTANYNCPTPYDVAKGNLGLWVAKLDTTTPLDGGTLGAQFAYASYPFLSAATLSTMSPATAVAGLYVTTLVTPEAGTPDAGDAGDAAPVDAGSPQPVPVVTSIPIAVGATYGQLTPTTLAPVSGLTFDGMSGFFVSSVASDGGPSAVKLAVPLPKIQAVSDPANTTTSDFANGKGYVFVLVGDPGLPTYVPDPASTDGGVRFNPLSAHILGFPTNPPFGN